MPKICFVITPLGSQNSVQRRRADYVLNTYIKPACKRADYEAKRADHRIGQNIAQGINTALQNAPMTIAYLGGCRDDKHGEPAPWGANIMLEVGFRLATRLPLVLMCDEDSLRHLPLSLSQLNVIPVPTAPAGDSHWEDPEPELTVDTLRDVLREESKRRRYLDSMHPLAMINAASADTRSPDNLYYTAASVGANELLGLKGPNEELPRLSGYSMTEFLTEVRKRMHPAQWAAFERDQNQARGTLNDSLADQGNKACTASVPIVFENHEREELNRRAYLPIVVQNFRPDANGASDWYNLRVLYLNVTTATTKVTRPDGTEFYQCNLDPTSSLRLEPLRTPEPGIRVFLSYDSTNRDKVERVYDRLAGLKPHVDCFIDYTSIGAGANWVEQLGSAINWSEICFLFLDDKEMRPGLRSEFNSLVGRMMADRYPIVPVCLNGVGNPFPQVNSLISTQQWIKYEQLDEDRIRRIFWELLPHRCPRHWRRDDGQANAVMA